MKISWKAVVENLALFVDNVSEEQTGMLTLAMKEVNSKASRAKWQ